MKCKFYPDCLSFQLNTEDSKTQVKDTDTVKEVGQSQGHYTPGIYADGYIVFAFPFVRLSVRMFVSSFVRSFVEFASKFCVKVSQVVYISATTHQKAFIRGAIDKFGELLYY